ncbi:MAG: hypothetical protein JWO79_4091 [Actinomycetia bacterium]|nr:hypothetical protein [Actinomycetes bacterium]
MTFRRRSLWFLAGLATAGVTAGLLTLPSAEAQPALPKLVSANPADFTPQVHDDANIQNASIYAFAQVGDTMFAGGRFRTITTPNGKTSYPRNHLMAFSATTGEIKPFAPVFGGPVWALAAIGNDLYVGGEFSKVNGVAHQALVKLDATTGVIDPDFDPPFADGRITEMRVAKGRLFVSGTFARKLVALDPRTGMDTKYVHITVTGTMSPATDGRVPEVLKFAIDPAGTKLVAVGNFNKVDQQWRPMAFMLTLGRPFAALNAWYYPSIAVPCIATGVPDYVRDVDFSPDGSFFAFTGSGGAPQWSGNLGLAVCDAVSRFESGITYPTAPTWVNYTGGDTLHSLAITGSVIYVQGHQRWLNNAGGNNFPVPNQAVDRQGIAAVDAATGKVLDWNPGKDRGVGGKRFLVTPAGLWVGSDGRFFAGEQHWGLAFLPLNDTAAARRAISNRRAVGTPRR